MAFSAGLGASLLCASAFALGAELHQDGKIAVNLALDREVYLPGSPVLLTVELMNPSDLPGSVDYNGPWPPPWQLGAKVVYGPFDFNRILEGMECSVSDPAGGAGILTLLKAPEPVKGTVLAYPAARTDIQLKLAAHDRKCWRVPLPLSLIKPGKYEINCALPPLKAIIGQETAALEVRRKLGLTVIAEADTLKGIEADVRLVLGENAVPAPKAGEPPPRGIVLRPEEKVEPALVWTIKPPKDELIREPAFLESNCRVIIRDGNGRLLQERFFCPTGFRQEGEAQWKEPLSWVIPLRLDYFARVAGELFPGPGTYTVEASYRDFVTAGQRLLQITPEQAQGKASPFYVNQRDASSDQAKEGEEPRLEPSKNYEVDPKNLESPKGRWIAFSKTFRLEITPERWKLMQKDREAK